MEGFVQGVSQILSSSGVDVAAIILGGFGVSYAARLLNHLFGAKDRKVTSTVVTALAFIAPCLQALIVYAQQHHFSNQVIPHFSEILTVATLVYNFILKGGRFDQFLLKVEQLQTVEAAAADGVQVVTTPVVPPSGTTNFSVTSTLPVVVSPTSTSEFDI